MRFSNIKCNLLEFKLFYFNSVTVDKPSMLYYSRTQRKINLVLFNHDDYCIYFYPQNTVIIIFFIYYLIKIKKNPVLQELHTFSYIPAYSEIKQKIF